VISHIHIGVNDFPRAFAFYSGLMGILGHPLKFAEPEKSWAGWQPSAADRPLLLIGRPFDGRPAASGNGQMLALLAPSRKAVADSHAFAIAHGGRSEGAPGLRPQYHPHYFGTYFRDPDGNKLCVCCHAPEAVIELVEATARTADVAALIGELNDELGALYTPDQRHGLALDAIFQPDIRFFLARREGRAVGCGGVAFLDGFAELKRMYVRPEARGQGIADAIIARLAAESLTSGRDLLRLETGSHSLAAIGFYSRQGFRTCDAFAPYAAMPRAAIITSVFMEKRLSTPLGAPP
jgi:ribosomal protein S18 acetylase RimI-like enzyme